MVKIHCANRTPKRLEGVQLPGQVYHRVMNIPGSRKMLVWYSMRSAEILAGYSLPGELVGRIVCRCNFYLFYPG